MINYDKDLVRFVGATKDTLGVENPDGWIKTFLLYRDNSDIPKSWFGYVLQYEVNLPKLPHENDNSSDFFDLIMQIISEEGYDVSCFDCDSRDYFQHEPTLQLSLHYIIVTQHVGYDR